MEKKAKFPLILLAEEYEAHDFVEEHKNETHTLEEWEVMIQERNFWYVVKHFFTLEQRFSYETAIRDVENYLSSDFYTFAVITNITD